MVSYDRERAGSFGKKKKKVIKVLELHPLIKRVGINSIFEKISKPPTDTEVHLSIVMLSLAKTTQRKGNVCLH